jgi:hypothetical protein
MTTPTLTPPEYRAMLEIEQAEHACVEAQMRLHEARERYTDTCRRTRHKQERPTHLRLVRPNEPQEQTA